MKKIVFLVFGIIIGSFSMFFYNYLTNSNDSYENVNNNEVIRYNDTISMMLETEAGSGNYEMTTANGWPTDGYVFNTILSKCENGGELSWDDTNKRVLMSGNVSDKCYVYFDKVVIKPVIKNVSFDILSGSWGIQSMDIDTVRPISRYYIKVKNDSFTEFSIGVRSFCSPNYRGELTYYFYVVNDAGVSSDVFTYIFNNTDNEKTVGDCPIV
jgi:hypothetical protein